MRSQLLSTGEPSSPLGTIRLAGHQWDTQGIGRDGLRVLGAFAIVLVRRGNCVYFDPQSGTRDVRAGHLMRIHPDVAHRYRPPGRRGWDETYVVFDGPAFEVLAETNVFPAEGPVVVTSLEWRLRFDAWIAEFRQMLPREAVVRLFALLTQLDSHSTESVSWLDRAKTALGEALDQPLDLATLLVEFDMGATAFRSRFKRETGLTPAAYRRNRRLEVAAELLSNHRHGLKQIAANLGFYDEFHLSRAFRAHYGVSPRDYRRGKRV